ncbi:hypothetical protein GGS23DRAFT_580127 [Durotheca rogersii]|uniref:uncharacterized protein n=1 Tax=Durotheca rogersii TaxID=419775 RepID=UPI00221E94B0|nr:uncharacterized protein GGS23DRAFT_580127 [Durotheca rogersii]KAI5860751.1 hypothetical protein GGS23DRAFT_580127 [Durotheca rogersii]
MVTMDPTNPPPEQSQPQRSAAPQYTTVGSVWNPQSLPLQPPVRRGRAMKSALMHPYSDRPSSTVQHYSPLQQNFDRAVSPDHPILAERIAIQERERAILASSPRLPVHQPYLHTQPQAANPPTFPANPFDAGDLPVEGRDRQITEPNDTSNTLIHMTTKSLTNLASYPNPMQKSAQKMLEKARQPLAPATNQAPDPREETDLPVGGPPASLRDTRSEFAAMAHLPQSDRADEYGDFTRLSGTHDQTAAAPCFRETASRLAVLSRGPGAPQPLTAGPPGQRQYRPSGLDPASDASRRDAQRLRELNDVIASAQQSALPSRTPQPLQLRRRMHTIGERSSPVPESRGWPSLRTPANIGNEAPESLDHIIDTLPPEEARKFYPHAFPSNYNYVSSAANDGWWKQKLLLLEDGEELKLHSQTVSQHGGDLNAPTARKDGTLGGTYSRVCTLGRDFDIPSHRDAGDDLDRVGGSNSNEGPGGTSGNRFDLRPTVEGADDMAACNHAETPFGATFRSIPKYSGFPPGYNPPRDGSSR